MKLITFDVGKCARNFRLQLFCAVAAFFCIAGTHESLAQDVFTVTGLVTDSGSPAQPIAGAAVMIKGTSSGVSSNSDGTYMIEVPSPDATLVFTFFGLKTAEIPVQGRSVINVALEEDSILLDAVVAVGYGTMKKSDLTGSVASVKSDLMENKPISSFDNALRGQIAGVVVTQTDGAPGGGASIRIRGTSSINGTNEPLYVIDGVPLISESVGDGYGVKINPLSSLNSNDIESIEVLKDASATAIYGARGANGVILVTTKKGSEGRGQLQFSATGSIAIPEQAYEMLDGPQLAQLGKEAYENAGMPVPSYFQDPSSVKTETDWMDEIFRLAYTQNYQLNFSGGGEEGTV